MSSIRKAYLENALECAIIVDSWISNTKEMPRLFSKNELKQMIEKAVETYEQTLKSDLNNKIAKRRVKILSKRLATL